MIPPVTELIANVALLRDYFFRIAASDPALRTAAVVAWLESLPAGREVALYGCGAIAEALVHHYRAALDRHRVVFLESDARADQLFHGYRVIAPERLTQDPSGHIVMLSLTHEATMRRNVARFDHSAIVTLNDLIGQHVREEAVLARFATDLVAVVDSWAARLEERIPRQGLSGLFLLHSIGHHQLDFLKALRDRGMFVVAVLPAMPGAATRTDAITGGWVDDWIVASGYETAGLLAFLLLGRLEFSFFDVWLFHNNGSLIRFFIDNLPRRIVVEYDDYAEFMLENETFAAHHQEATGLSRQAALDIQRDIFTGAAGIIFKDAPQAVDVLATRYGHRPLAIQKFPVTVRERSGSRVPGPRCRVVFAHSCWKHERYQTYVRYQDILETVRILTSAGVHFTIFNNADPDGQGFEDLVAMSRANPLFDYRFRVPFEELLGLLPSYDFGWASYRFTAPGTFETYVKYTMGLKLFTYANAGLPVLVSPELEFMTSFVLERGIGLAVGFADWPRLPAIAREADYAQLRRNTQTLCDELTADRQAARICEFYRSVAAQPPRTPLMARRPVYPD